ncbi:S41 family peptidase [Myxococcus xanthus]|uniref:S41 family peptidase n=1 Tax=Myxococcus xanthus TaxID=34 RepID=UPI001F1577C0|nr:S41 family peptidase [Myxococcus xanthus]
MDRPLEPPWGTRLPRPARAISQAEHTGLMLEATTDTVFVGSPTSGTNGDITRALLPGGVVFTFTGQAVLHGDGRQLQKKGLEPHVKVRPTLAGLQAGLGRAAGARPPGAA